jgi:hypothetical protein
VSVYLNAWTSLYETWYVYHGTWALHNSVLHKSLISRMCICPVITRQQLGRHTPLATNTSNNRRIVGGVISKESVWIRLCIPLSLLGKSSVNTFPRQWRIVEGIVFYLVHVISKESRWLVLTRTCFYYCWIYWRFVKPIVTMYIFHCEAKYHLPYTLPVTCF